ncbi:MAG: cytochrome c oxidase subunit II [Bacteroidota bacterium]
MEAQSLISIAQLLIGGIFILVLINLYLVVKLKEIDPFRNWKPHEINGALFVVFGIVGTIAAAISYMRWEELMLLVKFPASEHGEVIDSMFWITMAVALFVTLVTNALLFLFSWMYRSKPGRRAQFIPENNMLEIVWTAIPAVVLTALVGYGAYNWLKIFDDPPENAIHIEMNARQFDWTFRYPGPDEEFGNRSVSYINDGQGNTIGLNLEDPKGHDDIILASDLYLPVGVPVSFTIRSRDVLHSATLPHFRMKMDAVPGMPTNFWLTPTLTTEQMREETGNPDFVYEMSCQQICGGAHWNMRREVVVVTAEEYQKWLGEQKAFYTDWQEKFGEEQVPNPVLPDPKQIAEDPDGNNQEISMN